MKKLWLAATVLAFVMFGAGMIVSQTVILQRPLSQKGLTAGVGYGTTTPTLANDGFPPTDGEIFITLTAGSDPTPQIYSVADSGWNNLLTSSVVTIPDTTGTVLLDTAASMSTTTRFILGTDVFANLGTESDGSLVYCSDCTIADPCAGVGSGAVAKRINSTWICN